MTHIHTDTDLSSKQRTSDKQVPLSLYCVCVCVCVCMRACVRACVCVCVRVCEHVYVVWDCVFAVLRTAQPEQCNVSDQSGSLPVLYKYTRLLFTSLTFTQRVRAQIYPLGRGRIICFILTCLMCTSAHLSNEITYRAKRLHHVHKYKTALQQKTESFFVALYTLAGF